MAEIPRVSFIGSKRRRWIGQWPRIDQGGAASGRRPIRLWSFGLIDAQIDARHQPTVHLGVMIMRPAVC